MAACLLTAGGEAIMLTPSLTDAEKRVVKALLNRGDRAQDIHVLVNTGRVPSVNPGRISAVRTRPVTPASDAELSRFTLEKSLVDLRTGLSPFADERLIRSREAMLLAIQVFNMPLLRFKVEVFAVLSNIAWTYLLHEHYVRKGTSIVHSDGTSLLLSQMLRRSDTPLSKGIVDNLGALKIIRDAVEHKVLGSFGQTFYGIFQANCLNFENTICDLFGAQLSLGQELNYALQLSRLSLDQTKAMQKADAIGPIEDIDAELAKLYSASEMADPEFKFKVSYSLEKASKGDSHFTFTNNIDASKHHNVLVQKVSSDENWPHKPADVITAINKRTNINFSVHNHTQAWRKLGVRPKSGSSNPGSTKPAFCTYNKAHKDYTYSDAWIDELCTIVEDSHRFAELRAYKLK